MSRASSPRPPFRFRFAGERARSVGRGSASGNGHLGAAVIARDKYKSSLSFTATHVQRPYHTVANKERGEREQARLHRGQRVNKSRVSDVSRPFSSFLRLRLSSLFVSCRGKRPEQTSSDVDADDERSSSVFCLLLHLDFLSIYYIIYITRTRPRETRSPTAAPLTSRPSPHTRSILHHPFPQQPIPHNTARIAH